MLFKVCGLHGDGAEAEAEMLAEVGVDLVGLWHGVGGGAADLSSSELVRLAAVSRTATLVPVLVTFQRDVSALCSALCLSRVSWVQLHGFQLPSLVRDLRKSLGSRAPTIVKVLHAGADGCLDVRLVSAYERAGVDAFLLDGVDRAGRIGSTGEPLCAAVALDVVGSLDRPFFLAGGISAEIGAGYAGLAAHEHFAGIDVSTAARDADGRLRASRVEMIGRAWRAPRVPPEAGCRRS
jgi:phosphoribosylanthranilate isomerase